MDPPNDLSVDYLVLMGSPSRSARIKTREAIRRAVLALRLSAKALRRVKNVAARVTTYALSIPRDQRMRALYVPYCSYNSAFGVLHLEMEKSPSTQAAEARGDRCQQSRRRRRGSSGASCPSGSQYRDNGFSLAR